MGFETKKLEFMEVVARAVRGATEFEAANERKVSSLNHSDEEVRWSAPMEGMFKLNTDATVLKGVGMVWVVWFVILKVRC